MRTSLPAPPNRLRLRQRAVGLVEGDGVVAAQAEDRISVVLATVGVPPVTATAPPLTRILPAALRLIAMVLSAPSPSTVSTPPANVAVVAALAGRPVAANTPAASTTPISRRSAVRRQSLVCLVVIVPLS